jgi:hypothetical protein
MAVPSEHGMNASHPFNAWQKASATLLFAEQNHAGYGRLLRLAEQVIRTRNALILDRVDAGWEPSAAVRRNLVQDELLLRERDDTPISTT